MKRSKIDPMPQFFDRYINLAEDIDIVDALTKHLHELPDTCRPPVCRRQVDGEGSVAAYHRQ